LTILDVVKVVYLGSGHNSGIYSEVGQPSNFWMSISGSHIIRQSF